ncbi:Fibrinogen, alpha/beta/gamma chain, C-terminal globular domain [Sergentomyia squamirostris]
MSKKFLAVLALLVLARILRGDDQKVEVRDKEKLIPEEIGLNEDLKLLRVSIQIIQSAVDNLNGIFLHNLEPKLSTISMQTTSLDSNIKTLQEKTQNWHILQHHVNAWSDHMKSMDKKIDLLKQSQESLLPLDKTIADFEFKVNHIFDKVDILNEKMHEMLSILYHIKNPTTKNDPPLEKLVKNVSAIENHMKIFERFLNQNAGKDLNKNIPNFTPASIESLESKEIKQIVQHLKSIVKKVDNIGNAVTTLSKSVLSELNDLNTKSDEKLQGLKQIEEHIDDQFSTFYLDFAKNEKYITKIQDIVEKNHEELKGMCMNKNLTYEHRDLEKNKINEFRQPFKSSCQEVDVRKNGVYHFGLHDEPNGNGKLFNRRLCEFATTGPAWTVIQTRGEFSTKENFNRSWTDYKYGFGNLENEFWFGNDYIHQLTNEEDQELRVELENYAGKFVWTEYQTFYVGPEESQYRLEINGYRGIISDSFLFHNLQNFSTYDRDSDPNDLDPWPCARSYGSGWWFRKCGISNLNGKKWWNWIGDNPLKSTKMMIRSRQQNNTLLENDNITTTTGTIDEDF